MKTYKIILIAFAFTLLCVNVFGQEKNYPFQVKVSGKGKQALIFIPGFASSGEVWKETLVKFEDNYTCYTFTMAGFAGVPPQPNASFKNWESAVADYIKAKKINRPILIGHSMGGGLALAIAADYPDLLSKIVVVDALPCLAAVMNPGFKPEENKDCSSAAAQFKNMSDPQFEQMQEQGIPRLVMDTTRFKQIIGWSLRSDRSTFGIMYCDFMNTDQREKITAIKCPALILLEANFANFKATGDQYKNLKTAEVVYATKGLHFIMYDDTAWYNEKLTAFIK